MKRAIFALSFAVMAMVAWAQPKVAVLDAIIPQNMDPSVIVPVTDKIVERLVVSGRFTVLDRANIDSVLKEREFQMSGMVTDQDVVTAGKYLGADFVVVAKVQKVSETYFISAKMINVKTGVIANQTSAQGEGKLSTLIDLASQVGEVLSGGAVTALSSTGDQQDISKPSEPAATPAAQPAVKPKPPASPPSNIVAVSMGYSWDGWTAKASDSYGSLTENFDLYTGTVSLAYVSKYFQLGTGVSYILTGKDTFDETYTASSNSSTYTAKQLDLTLSALGKLPFQVGDISIFALGGVEYDMNLSWTASDGTDLRAYNGTSSNVVKGLDHLFFQLGGGCEISLGSLYILPEVIYGWKMPTADDGDWATYYEGYYSYSSVKIAESKLDFNLLVGFKI